MTKILVYFSLIVKIRQLSIAQCCSGDTVGGLPYLEEVVELALQHLHVLQVHAHVLDRHERLLNQGQSIDTVINQYRISCKK